MTTYSDDFSSYTVGSIPTGWTNRWAVAGSTFAIRAKAGAIGGKVLEHTGTTSQRRLLSWNAIDADPNRANSEILLRFRMSDVTALNTVRIMARASGAIASEQGYYIDLPNTASKDTKYWLLLGGTTYDGSVVPFTWVNNVWYYVRLRLNGVNFSLRMWDESIAEPATWNATSMDGSVTAAGWVGIGGLGFAGTQDFDYISVGTNGDTAPMPVIAAPTTQQPQMSVMC